MAKEFKLRLPAALVVALSFFIIIVIGTSLLCIPAASKQDGAHFMNALFTATSATCVTGLAVVDTFNYWTYFGQAVILCLIQIGGLGFITIISLFVLNFKRGVTLSQRKLVMQSAGSVKLEGVKKLVKYIFIGTFAFEFLGAFALCFSFVPKMGWGMGIWQAVFTSVSAFCNAGFTLTDKFGQASLTAYISDPLVNIVICLLIIIGGIGFFVWQDVVKHKYKVHHYSLHSKITLVTTAILIVTGWILFGIFEWNNSETIGDYDAGTKILASLFMSVSPRTAGFNTVNLSNLSGAGSILTMVFMLIGGCPGSTAGGIKTTTIAVFVLSAVATSRRYSETYAFRRKLERDACSQAGAVVALYATVVVICIMAIAAIDPSFSTDKIAFEVISAVGTVGLSCSLTPVLSVASQVILILLMVFGRVGGYTFILIFSEESRPIPISRVTERIIIG